MTESRPGAIAYQYSSTSTWDTDQYSFEERNGRQISQPSTFDTAASLWSSPQAPNRPSKHDSRRVVANSELAWNTTPMPSGLSLLHSGAIPAVADPVTLQSMWNTTAFEYQATEYACTNFVLPFEAFPGVATYPATELCQRVYLRPSQVSPQSVLTPGEEEWCLDTSSTIVTSSVADAGPPAQMSAGVPDSVDLSVCQVVELQQVDSGASSTRHTNQTAEEFVAVELSVQDTSKRGQGTMVGDKVGTHQEVKKRLLARNCIAARKCRIEKRRQLNDVEARLDRLGSERSRLIVIVNDLREVLFRLKMECMIRKTTVDDSCSLRESTMYLESGGWLRDEN